MVKKGRYQKACREDLAGVGSRRAFCHADITSHVTAELQALALATLLGFCWSFLQEGTESPQTSKYLEKQRHKKCSNSFHYH